MESKNTTYSQANVKFNDLVLKVNKTMTETRSLLIDYLNNPKQWYSMKLFIYKTRQDKINLSCIYDLQDKIDFIDP